MVRVACLVSVLCSAAWIPAAHGRELATGMRGPSLPARSQAAVTPSHSERFAGKGDSALRELPSDAGYKRMELLASHTDKRSRTTVEIGALGGGRADAPSLLHVGLGWTF